MTEYSQQINISYIEALITMKKNIADINTYLIIALIIAVGAGLYFTLSVPTTQKEAPKLKEITITLLGTDCSNCFNMKAAPELIAKQGGIKIKEVKEIETEKAGDDVVKYKIERLPAILITGEIANLTMPEFRNEEQTLVFDKTPPPYYDVAEKRVKGIVELVQIEPNCNKCFNISEVVVQLEQIGIKFASKEVVSSESEKGKELIQKYKIEKLPTLLFNAEVLEYDVVKEAWEIAGTQETDGRLILRMINPPYVNTATGKTEGIVSITYILDKECNDCYNASILKTQLRQKFNMNINSEEEVDVSTTKGKLLIKKHSIALAPTIIISKEANAYTNFAEVWKIAGSEEQDGSFVFRNLSLLAGNFQQETGKFVYKNMTSGQTIVETAESND